MPPLRSKRLPITIVVVVLVMVSALPALVAYRYTAPEQRGDFLRRPWRGWTFALAALAVPADSELKTSGMALRSADWRFRATPIDPQEVQLIFTEQDVPYTFTHSIGSRSVTTTVTPSYRFMWQVRGTLPTVAGVWVIAVYDYETGRILYDVRDDLLPGELPASATPSPSSSPSTP